MNPTYQKMLIAAILAIIAAMTCVVFARMFFGLSQERMLIGLAVPFTVLLGIFMLPNRVTHGVWIKRLTVEERVVLNASLKRARLGYIWGSLALLPVALAMIKFGFDANTATALSVLGGAIAATTLFMRNRRHAA